MSSDPRRTDLVLRIVRELFEKGGSERGLRPSDVNQRLRELNMPMGGWEVRRELANLEAAGEIVLEPDTAAWFPARKESRSHLRDTG